MGYLHRSRGRPSRWRVDVHLGRFIQCVEDDRLRNLKNLREQVDADSQFNEVAEAGQCFLAVIYVISLTFAKHNLLETFITS